MALGDKTKRPAFEMWKAGKSLEEIQEEICRTTTTKRGSVKGWILDWEQGKQAFLTPSLIEKIWNRAMPWQETY